MPTVIDHATINTSYATSNGHATATPLAGADDPISRLRDAFPWPAAKPQVKEAAEFPGWFGAGTDTILARMLPQHARVVVELGAWLGMSTRHIAKLAPEATVISVDHWEGSPEHRAGAQFQGMLPTLYDSFLAECWDYRNRIIPLRLSTVDGLRTIAKYGIEPDLIFIDAEHSYEAVTTELELASELFPQARLVGDDFDWRGVQDAVQNFARRRGMNVDRDGARGWALSRAAAPF
jgi:Methyltransferase domain